MIPLGPWTPDLPEIRAPHLQTASGVLPMIEGYEPFNELSITTDGLTGTVQGVVAVRDKDQATHMFAGDSTKLYELEGFSWTDRSKTGNYGPGGTANRWRFSRFGDRLVAVNGLDGPQYIDMSTAATQFADLAGSPPAASFVTTFGDFVVLGGLSTDKNSIKWSGFGNSEQWTPGTNQSDEQIFYDNGAITGLAALDECYIFQQNAIHRMLYVGGPTIMQIDKLSDGVGCIEPNSLVQWGRLFFFLAEDGFYLFDGASPQPIGVGQWAQWFLDNAPRAYWDRMSAAINPNKKLVCWAFSRSSGGLPDTVLFYNWVSQKASYVTIDVNYILSAASLAISPDDLTSTDVDTLTYSFDDPFFLGGADYFAGFDRSNKMGSFSGDAVAALLETGDYQPSQRGRASISWFRPVTDALGATVAGAAVRRPGTARSFGPAVVQQASGRCPQRGINGNFVRARLEVPAAEDWSYAQAIDLSAKPSGVR